MAEPETGKAVQVLDLLLEYFSERGERWTRVVLCPALMLAALIVGICRASLGHDAHLEAPGLAPFPTTLASGTATLFQNLRIFDGKSAALWALSNVLVRNNTIERISVNPITIEPNANVHVMEANGRVLGPLADDAESYGNLRSCGRGARQREGRSHSAVAVARNRPVQSVAMAPEQRFAALLLGSVLSRHRGNIVFSAVSW
jgi:hypothetical protein